MDLVLGWLPDISGLLLWPQAVKAPEIVLDGQDLDAREPGLARIATQRLGTHNRAGAEPGRINSADGQAVQNAPSVHEALELIPGRAERLGHALVGHQYRAARRDQRTHRPQSGDRV